MALIRRADAKALAQEALVLDLGDLHRQGEALLARARERAEAIVREAHAERERLVAGGAEHGYREGFERGTREGFAAGMAEGQRAAVAAQGEALARLDAGWSAALGAFAGARGRMLEEARRDVLRLALAIAERVTRGVAARGAGVVPGLLDEALALVLRPTGVVVRVHPDDLASVRGAVPGLLRSHGQVSDVEVVADASLARGACVVRLRGAGGGEIDASVETQLARISAALLAGQGGGAGDGGDGPDGAPQAAGGPEGGAGGAA